MAPVAPLATSSASLSRPLTTILPPTDSTPSFLITTANKSYKHQYANIYFVRLRILRDVVEEKARQRWHGIKGNPTLVPKVLEVEKSQLCYIVGTVYMDMPLKPNVMEDIARDNSIPPPPPLSKFYSPDDNIMLEDESGRIQLVGERVVGARLVTGVIIAALGIETPTGEFEVVDICYAEMAPQPTHGEAEGQMDIDADPQTDPWIAVVSGLDIGSTSPADAQIQMLVEYLTGEEGGSHEQISAAQISRLIIAGDSLAPVVIKGEGFDEKEGKKGRRYGYDATSFSPHPTLSLSAHLLDIARAMPIHLLPGETDPSGVILPQQPFPRAMFGAVSSYGSFSCETNPTYLRIASGSESETNIAITRTLLVNSGQPLNDMFKYVASPPNTPLSLLESTIRWRHMAPTAPDTLWCHPYFSADPFLISETPDLYIVGGQPRFGTKMVSEKGDSKPQKKCRVVLVPRFADTGILVLVNLRTLDVKCVKFGIRGMCGSSEDRAQDGPPASMPSTQIESNIKASQSSPSSSPPT
ncbi:DNA polymerase alpha/epsilon subunit B-domain-containing protein [Mycena capillaripes]|nr:DNA polymerase alpha/epsilon subunit B-domain-containing protein [Mycena capillaripes]